MESSEVMDGLLKWLKKEHKAQSDKIFVGRFGSGVGLRGLGVRQDVLPGEVLLRIPIKAALTIDSARDALRREANKGLQPALDTALAAHPEVDAWCAALGLCLCLEKQLGCLGEWWPYLESLPRELCSVLKLSPASLERVEEWGPELAEAARFPAQLRAFHTLLCQLYEAEGEGGLPRALESRAAVPGWEDFVWGYEIPVYRQHFVTSHDMGSSCTIPIHYYHIWTPNPRFYSHRYEMSRCRGIEDEEMRSYTAAGVPHQFLLPCLDMLNHDRGREAEIHFNYSDNAYRIIAKQPMRAGEQLFISYGRRSNPELLVAYGFMEPLNPEDAWRIALPPHRTTGGGEGSCPRREVVRPLQEEEEAKEPFLEPFLTLRTVSHATDYLPADPCEPLHLVQISITGDTGGRAGSSGELLTVTLSDTLPKHPPRLTRYHQDPHHEGEEGEGAVEWKEIALALALPGPYTTAPPSWPESWPVLVRRSLAEHCRAASLVALPPGAGIEPPIQLHPPPPSPPPLRPLHPPLLAAEDGVTVEWFRRLRHQGLRRLIGRLELPTVLPYMDM